MHGRYLRIVSENPQGAGIGESEFFAENKPLK
jgi:hypothetical protein